MILKLFQCYFTCNHFGRVRPCFYLSAGRVAIAYRYRGSPGALTLE